MNLDATSQVSDSAFLDLSSVMPELYAAGLKPFVLSDFFGDRFEAEQWEVLEFLFHKVEVRTTDYAFLLAQLQLTDEIYARRSGQALHVLKADAGAAEAAAAGLTGAAFFPPPEQVLSDWINLASVAQPAFQEELWLLLRQTHADDVPALQSQAGEPESLCGENEQSAADYALVPAHPYPEPRWQAWRIGRGSVNWLWIDEWTDYLEQLEITGEEFNRVALGIPVNATTDVTATDATSDNSNHADVEGYLADQHLKLKALEPRFPLDTTALEWLTALNGAAPIMGLETCNRCLLSVVDEHPFFNESGGISRDSCIPVLKTGFGSAQVITKLKNALTNCSRVFYQVQDENGVESPLKFAEADHAASWQDLEAALARLADFPRL